MSQKITHELAIGYGLAALTKNFGANGGWIQHQSTLIDSTLPFGEGRMVQLVEVVQTVVQEYESVERQMKTLFFGFEEQFLIVVSEGDIRLGLLFPIGTDESVDYAPAAKKFLRMNRQRICEEAKERALILTNEDNPWPAMEKKLRDMLTRVLNPVRAEQFMAKSLAEHPIPQRPGLKEAGEIARQIILDIPNRKRRRLMLEGFEKELAREGLKLS